MGRVSSPVPIEPRHDTSRFDCGVEGLNYWLRKKALKNEMGNSRTYVVCESNSASVVAYYTLSSGAVERGQHQGKIARNAPDPIPMILLGRLAVDRGFQGQGIAGSLVNTAFLKTYQGSLEFGIRGLMVHALNDDAKNFYMNNGFTNTDRHEVMTLTVTIKAIQRHLQELGII